MKTLIRRNWSGRIQQFTPPANLTSLLSAAFFARWQSVWPGAKTVQVLNLPKRTLGPLAKNASCLGVCLAALLCAFPNTGRAQAFQRIVAWGGNSYGQTNVPPGLSKAIAIAAGGGHSLALKFDGTVVAWGDNSLGQAYVPAGLGSVVAIAAGGSHSLALKSDGTVVAWGNNWSGQTNVPPGLSNVVAIAAGGQHSLALKSDGTVVPWGDRYTAQSDVPSGLSYVVAIAEGEQHSLALKSDGKVVAWGSYGEATNVPPGLSNVVAIAGSLALKSDGTVVAWGDNTFSQTNVPTGLTNVIAIAAGSHYDLALKSDGAVVAWGLGSYVPLGLSNVMAIAAGESHNLALIGTPIIETQPRSQVILPGSNVEFRCEISGGVPLAYQWFFNTTNLVSGATNTVLQLTNVQSSQSGAYSLVVSNRVGSVTSSPAMLMVTVAPVIVGPPTNRRVDVGDTLDFSVEAVGVLPLAYQWFFGTNAVLGATNSSLHLQKVTVGQLGAYTVVVTNFCGAVTSTPAMLELYPVVTVTACTEASLRAAMAGGAKVTLACDGTITLGSTITNAENTTLDGTGHHITLSGGNAVRVFCVETNVSFTATNVTIADGASDGGSGILNLGGNVTLSGVTFRSNSTAFYGGAILNRGGTVDAADCSFTANTAWTAPGLWLSTNAYAVSGGAIFNDSGWVNLESCCFTNNRASAGGYNQEYLSDWGIAQAGCGGAIFNSGSLGLNRCRFVNNHASGADGAFMIGVLPGVDYVSVMSGGGSGGAIFNQGILAVEATTFNGNTSVGGDGTVTGCIGPVYAPFGGISGASAQGGAIFNWGSLVLAASAFDGNVAIGGDGGYGLLVSGGDGESGGDGGEGLGGAICNSGSASLLNCAITFNTVQGGSGDVGGLGGADYPTSGGRGGNGGGGLGGAFYNNSSASLVNCTIAFNTALGGDGGVGGGGTGSDYYGGGGSGGDGGNGGNGFGGVCGTYGLLRIINCTVASNAGTAGAGGAGGPGAASQNPSRYPGGPSGVTGHDGSSIGGIKIVSGVLANTLLSGNVASNSSSTVTDAGHNLSSDASCAFTAAGSMNNTDPKLGPLADNGGPTLTMALLPGSPAIDAGSAIGAPATDQRGVPRPQGAGVDIGAFEYLAKPIFMGAPVLNPTTHQLQLIGLTPNPALTLQASTNLLNWWNVTNFTTGPNDAFQCVDPTWIGSPARFYRLKSGTP